MVTEQNTLLIAASGGPGAGKTTTPDKLAQRGFSIVPEVARAIIAERKAQGLSPRPAPEAFADARCEYELIEVPPGAVDERCDFILATFGLGD